MTESFKKMIVWMIGFLMGTFCTFAYVLLTE